MNKVLYWLFALLALTSCKRFVFHPNEVRPDEKGLNAYNIQKIAQLDTTPAFNFILIGDTQRFYEELEDFVNHVNSIAGISFVVVAGDLVDFGLNKEFNWIASKFGKLNVPYVSVIGNHDMLANGRKIFNEMFGPENFSFFYGRNKFICLNTNSREVDFNGKVPDVNWLGQQLNDDAASNIFVVSHVPPFNVDFDNNLEPAYSALLAAQPKTRMSLHGHEHNFRVESPYPGGIPYVVTAATNDRSYALIQVNGEQVIVTEKLY